MRIEAMTLIILTLTAGTALAAPSATVTLDEGSVLVDSGKGFVKIGVSAVVPEGSRILVPPRSKATLAYAEGCTVKLSPMSITTVSQKLGCKAESQVAGADLTPDEIIPQDPAPVYENGRLSWAMVGLGGAAAGGLVGYLLANPKDEVTYVYVPISH